MDKDTVEFRFYVITGGAKSKVRIAQTWQDVPLGAVPVAQKDWPKKPDYMDGRQYFLWWKNGFKLDKKEEPLLSKVKR